MRSLCFGAGTLPEPSSTSTVTVYREGLLTDHSFAFWIVVLEFTMTVEQGPVPEHGGIETDAEVDIPTLASVAPSVMVALTVTVVAALPWFVTSADVCKLALSATCEMRPVLSVTLFIPAMSVA